MSLVRGLVLMALVAGAAASGADAATGGAELPGGATPGAVDPEARAPDPSVVAAPSPPAAAPAPVSDVASPTTPASATAEQVALFTAPLRLRTLATAARRADDPVAVDLAALPAPSPIAAIAGHVIVVRPHMAGSELLDLTDPSAPRLLLASSRRFGTPHAGVDADGRPVIVISPCAGSDEIEQTGQAPRCPLRAIDVASGASRALPGTTGAFAGDLARGRLVFSRRSPETGVRLYASADRAAPQVIDLPSLTTPVDGWTPASGRPTRGTLRATSFDLDATGRLAVVLDYHATRPRFSSGLWLRDAAGRWRRLTTVGTTFRGMGLRRILGPRLDDTGVSAYVEGVVETPSFVARWTDAGEQTQHRSIRRSLGRSTILHDAAFDGDRLLFVDWLPGVPCGSEGADACGLRALPSVAPPADAAVPGARASRRP